MPLIDLPGLGHFKDRENAMIAENFAATKDYAAGDYCYFNGTLKKFKTAHAAGAWIGTDAENAKLAHDVTDLKTAITKISDITVVGSVGDSVAYTNNEEHCAWRFVNGAWQKTETSGTYYLHIVTYPVEAGKTYRVTGTHDIFTPLATFWTNDGTTPIGYSQDGFSATQREEITLDVVAPATATRMIVTKFYLDQFPIVYEMEYEDAGTSYTKEALSTQYKLPIKWRQATGNANGYYLTLYGCITDFLIPTAICDKIKVLATTHTIYVNYYNDVNGTLTYVTRLTINADYLIDKQYDFFYVNLFKNWTDYTTIAECDNTVELYSTLPYTKFTESIIATGMYTPRTFNKNDMWSVAHRGYNETGDNHNKRGGYQRAMLRGFTHGECDIKITSDNEVVCCHDDTFEDAATGDTITIATSTLAELQTHNYYGSTIATLAEIITECKRCGLKLEIDQVSSTSADLVCDVVTSLNAWDICYFSIDHNNAFPALTSAAVTMVQAKNSNAKFIITCNSLTSYSDALAIAIALDDAVFAVGSYASSNISALQSIATALAGKAKLIIWTPDDTYLINEALPYINGWVSNAISGDDIFNPTKNSGLKLNT